MKGEEKIAAMNSGSDDENNSGEKQQRSHPIVNFAETSPKLEEGEIDSGSSMPQSIVVAAGTTFSRSSIGSPKQLFSILQLFGLFAISFSYAFVFNSLTNIVIPKEVERLAPTRQSIWVGLIMSAGALCQLATPVVGSWSDRAMTRIPYLIYGSFIVIVGVILFLVVGKWPSILVLFAAHLVTTVGLSVQYAMVTALLNDHVADEQVGTGSGSMAILAIFGSGAGYAMFATGIPLHTSYLAYIISTVLCLGICALHIPLEGREAGVEPILKKKKNPAHLGPPKSKKERDLTVTTVSLTDAIAQALSMPSPTKYPDFFFACLGRCLFNVGLGGQVYLVYYVRDVLGSKDAVKDVSVLSVMALIGGIVGALPSGILSDRVGKKPVIYGALALCTLSLLLFVTSPSVYWLQFMGLVFGLGNVGYLSVDYALGVQALPKKHPDEDNPLAAPVPLEAAKDLGVFSMSATVGLLLGQVLYGAVLEQFDTSTLGSNSGSSNTSDGGMKASHFSRAGFVVVYVTGAICFILCGVFTSFIRGVR